MSLRKVGALRGRKEGVYSSYSDLTRSLEIPYTPPSLIVRAVLLDCRNDDFHIAQDFNKIASVALVLMLNAVLLGCLRASWKEMAQSEEIGKRLSIRNRFNWRS